jgi:TRAP-type uncharacterized transport system substrate-binding protein
METKRPNAFARMQTALTETFGLNRLVAGTLLVLFCLLLAGVIVWFIGSAPPRGLIISSGPPGSQFQRNAERYAKALAQDGIELQILPSKGSLENLQRLADPVEKADIGFVQGGLAAGVDTSQIVSLGSVGYVPIWIFYRSPTPMVLLSELAGKRLAIGAAGSGTHALATVLLQANGITPDGPTVLKDLDTEPAVAALEAGDVDAVFLMGDSASTQVIRKLLRSGNVHLYSFVQADAYVRRNSYLNKIVLPRGSIDFGKDLPSDDVVLVGPTVELLARKGLHPDLSDRLIQAARDVHSRPAVLQRAGEFPAPLEHEFPISDEAARFYRSGQSVLQRWLHHYWLASLVYRMLLVFVPTLLVLVPAFRLLPIVFRWGAQMRIYRWYRTLLLLDREAAGAATPEQREAMLQRLAEVERSVNRLKIPASFGDQFYDLRGHIDFVRARLRQAGS